MFKSFRLEAEQKGFRYFLEVFNPNIGQAVPPEKLGQFINDHIVRDLAGVTKAGRPLFLKVVYQGPKFMEQLASYDPTLIPGILGGASGTTLDAFQLLADAKKYGARIALYGRKINNSEHQLAFISFLRLVADGDLAPTEAVEAYHGVLQKLGIKPYRSLDDDMKLTAQVMSYASGGQVQVPAVSALASQVSRPQPAKAPAATKRAVNPAARPAPAVTPEGAPDFAKMSGKERAAYHRARIARI